MSGKKRQEIKGPAEQETAGPIMESQMQLARLIDFLPDPTFAVDRTGSVIAWNKAMEALTGISAASMLGKKNPVYSKIFYGSPRPMLADLILNGNKEIEEMYTHAEQSGDTLVAELKLESQDEVLHLWVKAGPIYDTKGTLAGAIESIRDITEKKRIEDELRLSEETYRAIFENTGAATVIIEDDTTISLANSEFEKLSGYTRSEIEGIMSWQSFVVEEDLERMTAQHRQRRKDSSKALKRYEFRFRDRLGVIKDISLTVDLVSETGKSVASLQDITERKLFELKLKGERDFVANLVETSPAFFVAMTAEGRILMMNNAMLAALSYTREEVFGENYFATFIPEEERAYVSKTISRIVSQSSPFTREDTILAKNGSRILLEWRAQPIFKEDGTLDYIFGVGIDITERKRIEGNLKASEAKYRDIFENVTDSLYVHDQEGRLIESNMFLKREYGYSQEDFQTMNIRDLLPERYKPLYKDYLHRVLSHGKDEGVMSILTKQGEHRILEFKNTLVRDEHGNPTCIRGSARDITERIDTERELRKSEQRYRLLAENIRDIIWVLNLDLKYDYISPSVERLRGYTVEETMAQTLRDVLTPESFAMATRILAEELGQEMAGRRHDPYWSRVLEVEMVCKDKSPIWTEVTASFLRDKEGNPTRILGITHDITERKIAEVALRTSEGRFRSLFEESADANLLIEDSLFIDCNQATLAMLRMDSKEQILDKSPAELSPELQPDGQRSDMKAEEVMDLAVRKGSHRFEWVHSRADGTEVPVEVVLTPITGKDSTIIHAVWRDISARKKAEEERQIYEARLMRAQKLEAIGTLAGGIAHDFNNILSAIIGYSELALDDIPDDNHALGSLHEVLKAGDRAKDLVSQILTFSRQVQAEKKVIRINIIVKEAMKLLRSSIPSTISIVQNIDSEAPAVFADPTQIHQVIMNLCTNAYQSMMDKGGVMTVGLSKVEADEAFAAKHPPLKPGTCLKLSVSDTGCGMEPGIISRIFEPFFTTKEKMRGTGLGLATVHGIVTGLSGTIVPESLLGQGSTFDIYFPGFSGETQEKAFQSESITRGNQESVLIVDDESAILEFGKTMLEGIGYTVATNSSSNSALELFRSDPSAFDLIITDQTMPGLTGIQLAKKLLEIREDLPIILVTGYSETVSPETALSQGIRVYLEKPFTRKALATAIQEALHKTSD